VGIVPSIQAGRLRNNVSIPGKGGGFVSLLSTFRPALEYTTPPPPPLKPHFKWELGVFFLKFKTGQIGKLIRYFF